MSSASDNEEVAPKTSVAVEATGGKRERKQTAFFSVAAPVAASKRAPEIMEEGDGMLLADYEFFVEKLGKLRSDDDVVKALHSLMYGTPGKKTETKKNLRAFRGFPSNSKVEEIVKKVVEKKKIWTVSLLKQALELFGCERSGDRDSLCNRLVNYLAHPENLKKVSGSKRKASSSAADGKRKKSKKSSKKSKKVKGPTRVTGFLLFSKASRAVLKEKKPELSFTEVSAELGRLWKSLSEEEQREWKEQAEEVNLAVAEKTAEKQKEEGEGEVEENEEENEEEQEDEEEEEGDEEEVSDAESNASDEDK